jgi:hypothetical protein
MLGDLRQNVDTPHGRHPDNPFILSLSKDLGIAALKPRAGVTFAPPRSLDFARDDDLRSYAGTSLGIYAMHHSVNRREIRSTC